ncbi:MAG TPA: DUF4332 domain-containing protein, partial [Lacipirellulaceae bacterium]|nr:DUF4332 domain-containing protein [Lacipirellulaceae bacterium]
VDAVTATTNGGDNDAVFYLALDASLAEFPVLGGDTAQAFAGLGLRTIEDLLAADAADVARRLAHPSVTIEAVRLWQRHTSLMCFVPGVSLIDAQVLEACDVAAPDVLFTIDPRLLAESIARFLATERGRRFIAARHRFTAERLAALQKHARRQRDRWHLLSPRFAWAERPAPVKPVRHASAPAASSKRRRNASALKPRLALGTHHRSLRFFLDRSRPVAEAPSIGPVAAEKLAAVGVRTVADLLNAHPRSTAEELDDRNISAATLTRWQHQARLACRIPELRGYGAQLLVACGFVEPEQIAATAGAELLSKIRSVCRTPLGRRCLRGGEIPTAERVAAWIRHAGQTRPLEAA